MVVRFEHHFTGRTLHTTDFRISWIWQECRRCWISYSKLSGLDCLPISGQTNFYKRAKNRDAVQKTNLMANYEEEVIVVIWCTNVFCFFALGWPIGRVGHTWNLPRKKSRTQRPSRKPNAFILNSRTIVNNRAGTICHAYEIMLISLVRIFVYIDPFFTCMVPLESRWEGLSIDVKFDANQPKVTQLWSNKNVLKWRARLPTITE